ncbi:MAG: hypothetical protein LBQ70_07045, partial [Prevotellaceae bacterium]|nr:hypothetical protein [Prevotellaceae bacterium]
KKAATQGDDYTLCVVLFLCIKRFGINAPMLKIVRTGSRTCHKQFSAGCRRRPDNRRETFDNVGGVPTTGGVKRCRILRERFRCHKYGFDDKVMPVASGLHNFRISFKESLINSYCT